MFIKNVVVWAKIWRAQKDVGLDQSLQQLIYKG